MLILIFFSAFHTPKKCLWGLVEEQRNLYTDTYECILYTYVHTYKGKEEYKGSERVGSKTEASRICVVERFKIQLREGE